eukprot:734869-Rhodomonas_salina.1
MIGYRLARVVRMPFWYRNRQYWALRSKRRQIESSEAGSCQSFSWHASTGHRVANAYAMR